MQPVQGRTAINGTDYAGMSELYNEHVFNK